MAKITSLFSNNRSEKEEDRIFIDAILNGTKTPIVHILIRYEKSIQKMMRHKNITSLESNEIFMEGLKRLIINLKEGEFRGESSVCTYLNTVCYNVCLDEIYKKQKFVIYNESSIRTKEDFDPEKDEIDKRRLELVKKYMQRLDKKCREIMDLRFYSKSDKCLKFNEISEIIEIDGENAKKRYENAKKRFQRCYKNLRELIESDPEFRELYT